MYDTAKILTGITPIKEAQNTANSGTQWTGVSMVDLRGYEHTK